MKRYPPFDPPEYVRWEPDPELVEAVRQGRQRECAVFLVVGEHAAVGAVERGRGLQWPVAEQREHVRVVLDVVAEQQPARARRGVPAVEHQRDELVADLPGDRARNSEARRLNLARIDAARWNGDASFPTSLLPMGFDRLNATAIWGQGAKRTYAMWRPCLGSEPDFHALSVFAPFITE